MVGQHLGPAVILLRLYTEFAKVRRDLVKNDEDQEAARRRPEILYEELSAGALYIEAQNDQRVPAETGPKFAEAKSGVPEVRKSRSVWTLMGITVFVVFTAIALIAVLMARALAADTVAVGIDLTTSSKVESEFKNSLDKVEQIITSQKAPGTRIVVLGITKDSFGAPIILTMPCLLSPDDLASGWKSGGCALLRSGGRGRNPSIPVTTGATSSGFSAVPPLYSPTIPTERSGS